MDHNQQTKHKTKKKLQHKITKQNTHKKNKN